MNDYCPGSAGKNKMAASLVKSMSKLCLSAQQAAHHLVIAPQNVVRVHPCMLKQSTGARNYASLLGHENGVLGTVTASPFQSQKCSLHTTSICQTTQEHKEWREQRVINRFYRLHWGGWIRTFGGRYKGLYKKSSKEQRRMKQHVFCTPKQCRLLDILVTKHWKEPKHFPDSPYEPYHKRTNSFYFPNHKKFYP